MQKIRAGIITAAFILATMLTTTSAATAAPSAVDGKRVQVTASALPCNLNPWDAWTWFAVKVWYGWTWRAGC